MPTVYDIIQTLISAVPGAPFSGTVDTLKTGELSQEVTGIVITFLATYEVIQQAAGLGANLIITHEPTFYNHLDQTMLLEGDPVYQAKARLIAENKIAIWRFHDYWHSYIPDGILTGTLRALGWQAYSEPGMPEVLNLPPMTLLELSRLFKEKLGINTLRCIGNPDLVCRRAALLVGAPGWVPQIGTLGRDDIDVLITGEVSEWETSEYARDAVRMGLKKGLIVTGHAPSEEHGMAYLAGVLRPQFPGLPVTFVPAGSPFQWV